MSQYYRAKPALNNDGDIDNFGVSMYLFHHHKNVWNTNKKCGSIRDYIIKNLAKREAKSKKIPVDGRW